MASYNLQLKIMPQDQRLRHCTNPSDLPLVAGDETTDTRINLVSCVHEVIGRPAILASTELQGRQ